MMDAGVVYVILVVSLLGGVLTMLAVELVDHVWAGRRQFPRGRR